MPWDYRNVENTNDPPCPRCLTASRVQCVWKPLYRCHGCGYSFEATYHEGPESSPLPMRKYIR